MVFFTCSSCGDTLKKNAVEKHYNSRCASAGYVTCMDCNKDFWGNDYNSHTSCITEDEKYGSSGTLVKEQKGKKKQEEWIQNLKLYLENYKELEPALQNIIRKIITYDNIPKKEKKFKNFVQNSLRLSSNLSDKAWKIFQGALKSSGDNNNSTQSVNNGGEEVSEGRSISNGEVTKGKSISNEVEVSNGITETEVEGIFDEKDNLEAIASKKNKNKKRKHEDESNNGDEQSAASAEDSTVNASKDVNVDVEVPKKKKKNKKSCDEQSEFVDASDDTLRSEESAKKGEEALDAVHLIQETDKISKKKRKNKKQLLDEQSEFNASDDNNIFCNKESASKSEDAIQLAQKTLQSELDKNENIENSTTLRKKKKNKKRSISEVEEASKESLRSDSKDINETSSTNRDLTSKRKKAKFDFNIGGGVKQPFQWEIVVKEVLGGASESGMKIKKLEKLVVPKLLDTKEVLSEDEAKRLFKEHISSHIYKVCGKFVKLN